MKKIFLLIISATPVLLLAQTTQPSTKQQKAAERRERVNQLIKQEEEGTLIYQKQGAFGIKLNTDGYGIFYEHGKYKTVLKTSLWWAELGERKNSKEEKLTKGSVLFPGLAIGNPFIYGKENNFYYLKLGIGGQKLIGGKGNKNGVAVSAIYGGGLSLGMLKPYYIQIQNGSSGTVQDIKYSAATDSIFLDPNIIIGSSGFGKGFSEITFVPGAHLRTSLRFDYGRYNEVLSALEVGLNAEYYTQPMPIMARNTAERFFFNAYIAIAFGRRK